MQSHELLTDCHIHIVALGRENSKKYGNIVRLGLSQKLSYTYIARYHGLSLGDPHFNEKYISIINDQIRDSRFIHKGVVFGLDGVYDESGKLNRQKTSFMITNEYVYDSIRGKKNLLFGASINPLRKDALKELDRVAKQKAALIKVLPNVQGFEPDDPKLKKFYREMAKKKIPLLAHTGYEFAIKSVKQSYGHPKRLRLALDEGVKVIAAHGGSTGLVFIERFKKTLLDLIRDYPHFYLDVSALSVLTRLGIVPFLRRHEEVKKRLIFGTDFPLPLNIYPFRYLYLLNGKTAAQIRGVKNYFDRYVTLLQALGLIDDKKPPLKF